VSWRTTGGHESAACPHGQEGPLHGPRDHEEVHGQQVELGDSAPLLCPGEATARVLRTILGSPVQERRGSPRESPVEGHKDDEGTGVSPV